MLPIGPLMEEHRVIEKLMPQIRQAVEAARREGTIDLRFVRLALDFVRIYADRCHHGKEEDILFKALDSKPMKPEHRKIMDELVEEHKVGRQKVRELSEAADAYRTGGAEQSKAALDTILDRLDFLASFYPAHIEKEDKRFFLPVMDYFDEKERTALIEAEMAFDREFVHEIYRGKLEEAAEILRAPAA